MTPPPDPTAAIQALAPLLPAIGTAIASAWVITRLNVRGLQRDTVTLLQTALAETRTEVAELRTRLDAGQAALAADQAALSQAQASLVDAHRALDSANAQLRVKDQQIASLQRRVAHLEEEAGITPTLPPPPSGATGAPPTGGA